MILLLRKRLYNKFPTPQVQSVLVVLVNPNSTPMKPLSLVHGGKLFNMRTELLVMLTLEFSLVALSEVCPENRVTSQLVIRMIP